MHEGHGLLTHEIGLLQGGDDTRLGGRRDHSHRVALILSPLQHLVGTWALLALRRELLRHLVELTRDEFVLLFVAHLDVVLLHEPLDHAAEVHTDKVCQETVDGVPLVDVVLLHDLIGEISAGLEGETLRHAEGVVTVEEDVFDLKIE